MSAGDDAAGAAKAEERRRQAAGDEQLIGGIRGVGEPVDDRDDGAPQRRGAGVQVVVGQRGRAQDTGERRQMLVVADQIREPLRAVVVPQCGQLGGGRFVLAPRRGQTRPEELGP